ncbi:MAG: SLBB domain-containing protein [Opitutaceae bacterium]|jgi:hypothetical protein
MISYPLIEIILYIALFFAPADATHVTLAGPDFAMELTRVETIWTAGAVKLSASDGRLIREENSTQKTQAVGDYVKAVLNHDWTVAPKITLHDSTSLEKTHSGFVVRVNDGAPAVRTYTITYRRSTPISSNSTASASPRTLAINVLGEVKAPGAYALLPGATLLDALAAAGGSSRLADTRKLSIVRGPAGEKPAVITHNADAILRGQAPNPPLEDHDTLYVPERIL